MFWFNIIVIDQYRGFAKKHYDSFISISSLNYIISITSFKLSLLVQNHIQIQKYFQNLRGRSYDSLSFFTLVLLLLFFPLECECMAVIHDQDISISIFLPESSFLFCSDLSSFSSTLVQITNYTNRCFKLDQTQQNIIFKKCVLNKVDKLEKIQEKYKSDTDRVR